MTDAIPLDLTMGENLQRVLDWQSQQTPTLKQTEKGVLALQPLTDLLLHPEGQSSEEVNRLADLLGATLASLDKLGKEVTKLHKEMAAANQSLTTLAAKLDSQDEQISAQGQMLKDLHDALLES